MGKARIEYVRDFEVGQVYLKKADRNSEVPSANLLYIGERVVAEIAPSEEFVCSTYSIFPVIVRTSGRVWEHGTRFLLTYLMGIRPPPTSTLRSVAIDLLKYLQWCEREGLTYTKVDQAYDLGRPTYRFSRHLVDAVAHGKLACSTASRRMAVVVRFYRWMQCEGIVGEARLWREGRRMVLSSGGNNSLGMEITTTDVVRAIRKASISIAHKSGLVDGRELFPLSLEELSTLRQTLHDVGNIEMELACEIAVATGARLETVLTLRLAPFLDVPPASAFTLKVGGNEPVKTKFNKPHVLILPAQLMQRLHIYARSEARRRRVARGHHADMPERTQYLFVTRLGRAFYLAEDDPELCSYHRRPDGNAVTKFIQQTLRPKLRVAGLKHAFKFHDLRATFGVQLVNFERRRIERVGSTLADCSPSDDLHLLNYVRQRMGHTSLKTTERYLTFARRNEVHDRIQREFEKLLFGEPQPDVEIGEECGPSFHRRQLGKAQNVGETLTH